MIEGLKQKAKPRPHPEMHKWSALPQIQALLVASLLSNIVIAANFQQNGILL